MQVMKRADRVLQGLIGAFLLALIACLGTTYATAALPRRARRALGVGLNLPPIVSYVLRGGQPVYAVGVVTSFDLKRAEPTAETVAKMIMADSSTVVATGGGWYKIALASGAENAFAFAEVNPFGVDVIITHVMVRVRTVGGTASAVLDVDVGSSVTATGDDILDGVDLQTAGLYDSLNSTDNGSNGEGRAQLWEKSGGTNDFLTAKILAAAASNLVGDCFVEVIPA